MSCYRVQFFNGRGGMARSERLECDGDDRALERLARLAHPHAMELWAGDRLVWRFEATRAERVTLVGVSRH